MKNDFRYPYAKTDNGNLIGIDQITDYNRRDFRYYCYGCGKELIPVLGSKREHHFRHKENDISCDRNKYLHEFAKNAIKERFEKSEHFYVGYNAKRKCKNKDNCEFVECGWKECYADDLYEVDLKKYYDTCECEKEYFVDTESGKKRYVADLMFFDSKDKSKFLTIEIWVTHECEEEKKKNKKRIIEIKIEKESDAYREIVESKDGELPIYFYNFKRGIYLDPSKKLYFIGLNNESEVKEVLCSDMKSFNEECKYALFADIVELKEDDKFNFVSIMLNKKGFVVNNCLLCEFMRYDSRWKMEFCDKYIPRMEKDSCYKNKCYERCLHFKYAPQREGCSQFRKYKDILFWEK